MKNGLHKGFEMDLVSCIEVMWINIAFRWLFMSLQEEVQFHLMGIIAMGFLPSIFTLSVSVVFAIAGTLILSKNGNNVTR